MKLLRFGPKGEEKPGLVDGEGRIRDLSGEIDDLAGAALLPATLDRLRGLDPSTLPEAPAGARIGPCVGRVGNFIAVGLNFADHAEESGLTVPPEPILFNKAPSCIGGPNDDVAIPPGSDRTDWEVELAVVIGSPGAYIAEADALSHVAGVCICNDVSERAYQIERHGQWMKGKGCPTFGPIGPWLATLDEVDLSDLRMLLKVNGETMQDGTTATMVYKVPFLVHYISQFMLLEPGDIITTGTPPGVGMGMKPPRYLKAGDVMEVEIAGLGSQRQAVTGG